MVYLETFLQVQLCLLQHHKLPEEAPSAPRPTGQPNVPTSELNGPQGTASFWETTEALLPPRGPRCKFILRKQLSPFPGRLEFPLPAILPDQLMIAKGAFTYLISSSTTQQPKNVCTIMSLYMSNKKKVYCAKGSSSQCVPSSLVNILTRLQVISKEQHGDGTTDNISTTDEVFADCALPATGPHTVVGTCINSRHTGLTFVGSLILLYLIGIGKYDFMVPLLHPT